MEPKTTVRGKYKKHKESFKIAVEYKLNTKLKGIESFGGENLYPLYIEVRAKRKRHYFPSYHMLYVLPSEFEQFKATELAKALFAEESELITNFVAEYYNNSVNENSHKWYNSYRLIAANDYTYHKLRQAIEHKLEFEYTGEVFEKNKIIDSLLYANGDYIKNTLDLLVSMKLANPNTMIQELIFVLRTYLRIKEFLSFYSSEWLSPNFRIVFKLEYSISFSLLCENQFIRNRIQLIGYQSDKFYQDLALLKEFIDSVENV